MTFVSFVSDYYDYERYRKRITIIIWLEILLTEIKFITKMPFSPGHQIYNILLRTIELEVASASVKWSIRHKLVPRPNPNYFAFVAGRQPKCVRDHLFSRAFSKCGLTHEDEKSLNTRTYYLPVRIRPYLGYIWNCSLHHGFRIC